MKNNNDPLTYQDYLEGVERLAPVDQLRLVEVISARLKRSLQQQTTHHTLTELEGLGAELWTGVDVRAYLRRERDAWD